MNDVAPAGAFRIRGFKKREAVDASKAREIWSELRQAIVFIQKEAKGEIDLKFVDLYRRAYLLCVHRHGDLLYDGVKQVVSERLVEIRTLELPFEFSLDDLMRVHTAHVEVSLLLKDVLMYMDRVYSDEKGLLNSFDMCLALFRSEIVTFEHFPKRIFQLVDSEIQLNRVSPNEADSSSRLDLVRLTLKMLSETSVGSEIDVYVALFENAFLKSSKRHLAHIADEATAKLSPNEYVAFAADLSDREKKRAELILKPSTVVRLDTVVQQQLVVSKAEWLVEEGAAPAMRLGRIVELSRVFELLNKSNEAIQLLLKAFENACDRDCAAFSLEAASVEKTGWAAERAHSVECVVKALELRGRIELLVVSAFKNDRLFRTLADSKLKKAVGEHSLFPKMLAEFADEVLLGRREKAESEVERVLNEICDLFSLLVEKDKFEHHHKRLLSKRLLKRGWVSSFERSVVSRLKSECGCGFTSKMEQMFRDMSSSLETFNRWEESLGNAEPKCMPSVLTSGCWPSESLVLGEEAVFPQELVEEMEAFKAFYTEKLHFGRRLKYRFDLGTATLRGTFGSNVHTLVCTTVQMCLLKCGELDFGKRATISSLVEATKLPSDVVSRHLISMTTPKCKLVLKTKLESGVVEFELNSDFSSRLKTMKVPLLALKKQLVSKPSVDGRNQHDERDVARSRQQLVDSAIVRLMKARKTLDLNELISETTRQLQTRFVPSVELMKLRIESLIEREYMERRASDSGGELFDYVA